MDVTVDTPDTGSSGFVETDAENDNATWIWSALAIRPEECLVTLVSQNPCPDNRCRQRQRHRHQAKTERDHEAVKTTGRAGLFVSFQGLS